MKKILIIALFCAVFFAAILVQKWYAYVTNTQSAYDEVGIELNLRAPTFMNTWGCAQLKKNFSRQVPPYGCTSKDPAKWD